MIQDSPIPENLKNLTEEQINQVIADSNLDNLRNHRNSLLAETDWTQNGDVPVDTKNKYEPYRQELRDITKKYQNLEGAVWPTPPS
tara:strand:- start:68 stop:325 length:258 start_codon:yes stop_codon:yes gene_type:complete